MSNNKKISAVAAALLGASQLFTSAAHGETTVTRDTPMGAPVGVMTDRPAVPTRATCNEDMNNPAVKQDTYVHGFGGGGVVLVSFGYIQPDPQKPEEIEYTGCVYQKVNQRPMEVAFAYNTATEQGRNRIQTLLTEAAIHTTQTCSRLRSIPRPPECDRR